MIPRILFAILIVIIGYSFEPSVVWLILGLLVLLPGLLVIWGFVFGIAWLFFL